MIFLHNILYFLEFFRARATQKGPKSEIFWALWFSCIKRNILSKYEVSTPKIYYLRFNVTVSGTCDWPYSDNSPLYFAHFAAESTLLFLGMNIVTLHAYLLTMPDFHVACLRVFILPPWIPFQVQPPAFYNLVAEFEARGFDSTTTPESGICAQVLRLSTVMQ